MIPPTGTELAMNTKTPIYHRDLMQGSDEWLAARIGLLTASEVKSIMTPTLKPSKNEDTRAHAYELLSQRLFGFEAQRPETWDMLRGRDDEVYARVAYEEHFAPVEEVGFITSDAMGFRMGYSPDGLVGDDGLIEIKSRAPKFQVKTILTGEVPKDYVLQIQTGLLITGRKWLDFISYSGGLPMVTIRVYPDPIMQQAIITAATEFEASIAALHAEYHAALSSGRKLIPTERRIIGEFV
jgi:hypothetical protein